jgi:hypothetical protein
MTTTAFGYITGQTTVVGFPANKDTGALTVQRGTASTAANTTYTATTAVDSTVSVGAAPAQGTVVGDYVFTADGFWGVVTGYSNTANNGPTTVTVAAGWNAIADGSIGTPAAGGAFTVHSAVDVRITRKGAIGTIHLRDLIIHGSSSVASVTTITDGAGRALIPVINTGFAAAAVPPTYLDLSCTLNGPVGLICTGGNFATIRFV